MKKNEKTSFWHYFYPNRDEKGREREKEFQSRIPFLPDPSQKIPIKNGKKL